MKNSPVLGLTSRDNAIHLECPKGTLTTPKLLLTNNGYASALGFSKDG